MISCPAIERIVKQTTKLPASYKERTVTKKNSNKQKQKTKKTTERNSINAVSSLIISNFERDTDTAKFRVSLTTRRRDPPASSLFSKLERAAASFSFSARTFAITL